MIRSQDLIEIGIVQKTHGIQGEIVVILDRDLDFESIPCVIMDIDGLWVPFFIDSFRPRSTESILLHLEGIDSEIDASELTRKSVYIMRDQIADEPDDEGDMITADHLIGYALHDDNTGSEPVGVVEAIREITPANWLFEVRTADGRELLIPIATDLITGVDTEHHILYMELPEGLTDL